MLCEAQAVEIYKIKMNIADNPNSDLLVECDRQWTRGKSSAIAVRYGVSSRAIRDIWNRKTWSYATQHLWSLENAGDYGDAPSKV